MYNFTHFRSVLLRKVKASSLEYLSLSGADCFVLHMLSDNLPPPLDGPVPYRDVQENRHEKWLGSHGQPQPKPAQINHSSIKANQCKKPSFSESLQMTTLKLVFAMRNDNHSTLIHALNLSPEISRQVLAFNTSLSSLFCCITSTGSRLLGKFQVRKSKCCAVLPGVLTKLNLKLNWTLPWLSQTCKLLRLKIAKHWIFCILYTFLLVRPPGSQYLAAAPNLAPTRPPLLTLYFVLYPTSLYFCKCLVQSQIHVDITIHQPNLFFVVLTGT